jgi:hypothetical protein
MGDDPITQRTLRTGHRHQSTIGRRTRVLDGDAAPYLLIGFRRAGDGSGNLRDV